MKAIHELTPRQIVKELDQYIIGQESAKKAVAIALRNRWRRRQIDDEIAKEIIPNNIMMIGPTGVGKTEIARRLARLSNAPFVKLEASKFTEVGYVGRDVDSIIRDLVESAVSQVRIEWMQNVEKEAEELVEERLLDLLLPPSRNIRERKQDDPFEALLSEDVSSSEKMEILFSKYNPDGNEDEDDEDDAETVSSGYQRSREKMRDRLRKGKFEQSLVELEIPEKSSGVMQVFGPVGVEEMGVNLQEMFGNLFPGKKRKREMTIAEARNFLLSEEIEKLVDQDAVIHEAIFRTEEMGIVFLDEIDKIASAGGYEQGPEISRQGVQRDILPLVEGTRVTTKYGPVNTDHILFIAAGAFHVARPSDLIPELQGRFPIRVELDSLNRKDFFKILIQPKNSLVKQYTALLKAENVHLDFDTDALKEIAGIASEVNDQTENIGARRLHTVMNKVLEDILFKIPSRSIKKITVTKEMVRERLNEMVENEDLSRYIL